jgi:hypothetical protein
VQGPRFGMIRIIGNSDTVSVARVARESPDAPAAADPQAPVPGDVEQVTVLSGA